MIAWKQAIAGSAFIGQLAITACGENRGLALGPERTLTGVHMTVKTSELWGTRNLMVVGEEGSVSVSCSWSTEIGSECGPTLNFVSSEPGYVSVKAAGVRSATLTAHAPGTAVISARVQNISRDTTIQVVSEPLPIDDLWVELGDWRGGIWWYPEDWCPACQFSYNDYLELEKILMPVGGSLPFDFGAEREGERVFGMESELASTDDRVAYPSKRCRPAALDPDCEEIAPHWVSALALGTATVSVTVRNLTVSFEVEVTDSP